MKKLIGFLAVLLLIPAVVMVGCSENKTPTAAGPGSFSRLNLAAQGTVNLGTAAQYGALAYTAITNSGPTTVCGSIGVYPLAQVDGGIVEVCSGAVNAANGAANIAKQDLGVAYTDAAGRTGGALLPPGADIAGAVIYRGLYTDHGNLLLSSSDVTLDGQGDVNSVFIFQVNGNLIVGPGRQVLLINGAQAANIFWQVTGFASLDTTVAFKGTIMAYTSVTMNTLAALQGRALAENGNVTFLTNTITQ